MRINDQVRHFANIDSALFQIHPIPQEYLSSPKAFNKYYDKTYPQWVKKIEMGIKNHPKGAEPFNLLKTYGLVQEIREYLKRVDSNNEKVKIGLRAYVEALEQDKKAGVKSYG